MAIYQPESFYSTTLAAAITAGQTTIAVTVAPNIDSGYLVIESASSNREIIKYTGVTGTTLTGCVRGLASYGSDDSGGTGTAHPAGVEIANKDVHYYYAQYYDFLTGTSATGANTMRIGDGNTTSASNRFWYAHTSSLSAFWGLSADGRMVVSEDGTTSYTISAGGSGLAAGDGIEIIASQIYTHLLSSSGLRISANQLAVDDGVTASKIVKLDSNAKVPVANLTCSKLLNFDTSERTTQSTDAVSMSSYSMPANTLAAGKGLRVKAFYVGSGGNNIKQPSLKFGSTVIKSFNMPSNDGSVYYIEALIFNRSTGAQVITYNYTSILSPDTYSSAYTTCTEDTTGIVVIDARGNVTNALDTLKLELFTVEIIE